MQPGRSEVLERGRAALERAKRTNAMVCVVLGTVFGLFAAACFVLSALLVAAIVSDSGAVGAGLFGLFWSALAALLLYLGVGGLRRIRRDRRLRESGVRGKATVVTYRESRLRVDGATKFELTLRVEIEGRPAWDVSLNEGVSNGGRIFTGAALPVLVNPADPTELMIDWFAR